MYKISICGKSGSDLIAYRDGNGRLVAMFTVTPKRKVTILEFSKRLNGYKPKNTMGYPYLKEPYTVIAYDEVAEYVLQYGNTNLFYIIGEIDIACDEMVLEGIRAKNKVTLNSITVMPISKNIICENSSFC